MRPEDKNTEARLDETIEQIKNEPIPENLIRDSGDRVWARISEELNPKTVESISGCEDFQALLPAYREDRLTEARTLLVRDHLHECIACRKEFMKQSRTQAAVPAPATGRFAVPKWAMAAMVVIGVALGGWEAFQRFGPPPPGAAATLAATDGTVYRFAGGEFVPARAGDELQRGELIRTARETRATVRLRDGSMVEMRERSGFTVSETRRDVTLRLARGSVIVEAAKRASGHLYVSTRDCQVAVTGTVFSVNSGVKGSRVSVVEGEVHVAQGGSETVLHPGEQYSSSPAMTNVPVAQEIAWSENADQYVALMKELAALGEAMDQQVQMPGVRYSSALMNYLPANTVVYAAAPNLGETMADAYRVFQNRLGDSPTLREWWETKMGGAEGEAKIETAIDEFRRFAGYLGNEIVVAAAMDAEGNLGEPVFLAELKQDGFADFLRAETGKYGAVKLRFFDSAASIVEVAEDEIPVYVNQHVVVASPNVTMLREVAAGVEAGNGGFADTDLYRRVAESYRDGSSFLLSANLEQLKAAEKDTEILGNVKEVVVGQKQANGTPDTRAIVTFSGERSGIAAWLAAPSPNGALDYVTTEATVVTAFAVKQPATVLDDLLASIPDFGSALAKAEAELGLSLRDDLAAAFGAEFVVAMDGPALPVPSWKLVAEVYNRAKLQAALQTLVDTVNRKLAAEGKPGLEILERRDGERTYYSVALPAESSVEAIHYTFVPEGYWIVAPTRALLDKAISARENHNTLVSSEKFIELLPTDGHNNFSALLYHNVGSAIAPLAGILTDEQKQAFEGLDSLMQPTLVLVYGASDQITVASTAEAFGFTPGNLFGLKAPLSLSGLFGGRHPKPAAAAQ